MQAVDEVDSKRRRRRRRRRRRDDPDRAGFAALLPQLLTTGNLAAGFFAIIKASNGDVLAASYAIFVAAVFDILDGRAYVARMVAASLSQAGVAALFVKLPYYAERRPKSLDPDKLGQLYWREIFE